MSLAPAALLYDDSAYTETSQRPAGQGGAGPLGLMGRQVAGREFLDAYLTHGDWSELTALVYTDASGETLLRFCADHPSSQTRKRGLRVVPMQQFREGFLASPAPVLHTPCPPDPGLAWARLHHDGAYALCGVTHTLCTAGAARALGELITAPFESYDALICTSTAVVRMVRAVTDAYGAYLRDRFGGNPQLRLRLEMIPLGVNAERYRPATPDERSRRRAALHIADDDVAVLFVGRFTPHAKAHPFPMLQGLTRAAQATGRHVHLILAGWAPSAAMMSAYLDAVRAFAPGMPVSVVDGMDPDLRFGVWHAADIFTSLVDNIQETFGLVIVEAMASGLPVVASDWNGYRDLVADGETGLLVPTLMVRDATTDATTRLLLGATDYDAFLGECNQAVTVDVAAAASAYATLLRDPGLRQRLGQAGRARILERFTWAGVIRQYETLWREQDTERRAALATRPGGAARAAGDTLAVGPACYPAPEQSFAGYPSAWLDGDRVLRATDGALEVLRLALHLPLCNYAAGRRTQDRAMLQELVEWAVVPRSIDELEGLLNKHGIDHVAARATIAWLLKYGIIALESARPAS